jgi:hypothetical protein
LWATSSAYQVSVQTLSTGVCWLFLWFTQNNPKNSTRFHETKKWDWNTLINFFVPVLVLGSCKRSHIFNIILIEPPHWAKTLEGKNKNGKKFWTTTTTRFCEIIGEILGIDLCNFIEWVKNLSTRLGLFIFEIVSHISLNSALTLFYNK